MLGGYWGEEDADYGDVVVSGPDTGGLVLETGLEGRRDGGRGAGGEVDGEGEVVEEAMQLDPVVVGFVVGLPEELDAFKETAGVRGHGGGGHLCAW